MRALQAGFRAVVLLSVVLDLPLLGWLVRRLTREPRVESVTIAGTAVEIVRPRPAGRWPTVLFVNGAHPLRRKEAIVQRLSRGLARAGYVVFVPDLPGLGDGEITLRTIGALEEVARDVLARPDVAGSRLTLVGASTGAGLALIAAARPDLSNKVAAVVAVAPFADLEKMTCLVTTSCYDEDGTFVRYAVPPLSRRIIARSLLAALPSPERDELVAHIARAGDAADPLEGLEPREGLGPDARAVVALLTNRDASRFRSLREALPPAVASLIRALSPVLVASSIVAPVEILVPPRDEYFPRSEATALARAIPTARVTMTATLDHTRPRLSVAQLPDLGRFLGSVTRSLALSA